MNTDSFVSRHIGVSQEDINTMLPTIGVASIEQLIFETIPDNIKTDKPDLPPALSEHAYLDHIRKLSKKNKIFKSYIGLGYHESITPSPIKRNILENPSWYTAYTPYQAEIAQGRLEALINYQTVVMELTGMEISNASLLDEGTAAAEAMTMLFALRDSQSKKNNVNKFFVSEQVLPQTIAILKTKAEPLSIKVVVGNHKEINLDTSFFGQLIQYPGKYGDVFDYTDYIKKTSQMGIKTAMATDLLSLVMLKSPGEIGADIAIGTSQRFGIPLGYGGPHAAFFSTKNIYKRFVPGRIIGVTKDLSGKAVMRMALQTREQHIKRDRATSNICTAQVLLAVMASMYAVYHGPHGLKYIAKNIHDKAQRLNDIFLRIKIKQCNQHFFDTLLVEIDTKKIKSIAEGKKINFNYIDDKKLSISINEATSEEDLKNIINIFEIYLNKEISIIPPNSLERNALPQNLLRQETFLQSSVFNKYHSETELMRYIKRLERKDLSLNHSMIALGSCTMKLNAATEMLPLSSEFWSNIHPYVPVKQAKGYTKVLSSLERYLSLITGFHSGSLQPNSGAQGEYTGLMVIREYHKSRGEGHRNICLIPASAHGTNPASAVLTGMKVVVVNTTEKGEIDIIDLEKKAILHKSNLSALMVTYPSTHGVFEAGITDVTKIIHQNGGQVYMDGANMNAQVALTSPAKIGADVCHLNLHKTFAIPHGGGGPGVGPIFVASHLASFLPSHPMISSKNQSCKNVISSAPFGNSLVCLVSYAYIRMLGASGLKKCTEIAILNANYLKSRLENHYRVLYTGEKNRVAHELVLDCRDFKKYGIEVKDIAKRLIDYGFHAPTVSFPVGGTLMIEPTESESKEELDRFCEALISIKNEIINQPELLKNSPHTLEMLTSNEWAFSYDRETAAYPLDYLCENKFWPSCRRVDEAFGDRNLICSCDGMEAYADQLVE